MIGRERAGVEIGLMVRMDCGGFPCCAPERTSANPPIRPFRAPRRDSCLASFGVPKLARHEFKKSRPGSWTHACGTHDPRCTSSGSAFPPRVGSKLVTGKARYSEPCLSRVPARSAEWVGGWVRSDAPYPRSTNQRLEQLPRDIRQPEIPPLIPIRQLRVLQPELMQQRRVQIIHAQRILRHPIPDLIRLPDHHALLHPTAREPHR